MLLVAVAAVVVTLDAIAKRIVQDNLALGEKRDVIPDVLVLTHVQNTGAAYGLLTGQRWLLVVTAAIIAAATPLLMRTLPLTGRWAWTGPVLTGMIVGGAAGNLVERARLGYVTDFVQTPPIALFQVFNTADASISVAITALLVLTFLVRDPPVVTPPVLAKAEGEAETEPATGGETDAPFEPSDTTASSDAGGVGSGDSSPPLVVRVQAEADGTEGTGASEDAAVPSPGEPPDDEHDASAAEPGAKQDGLPTSAPERASPPER